MLRGVNGQPSARQCLSIVIPPIVPEADDDSSSVSAADSIQQVELEQQVCTARHSASRQHAVREGPAHFVQGIRLPAAPFVKTMIVANNHGCQTSRHVQCSIDKEANATDPASSVCLSHEHEEPQPSPAVVSETPCVQSLRLQSPSPGWKSPLGKRRGFAADPFTEAAIAASSLASVGGNDNDTTIVSATALGSGTLARKRQKFVAEGSAHTIDAQADVQLEVGASVDASINIKPVHQDYQEAIAGKHATNVIHVTCDSATSHQAGTHGCHTRGSPNKQTQHQKGCQAAAAAAAAAAAEFAISRAAKAQQVVHHAAVVAADAERKLFKAQLAARNAEAAAAAASHRALQLARMAQVKPTVPALPPRHRKTAGQVDLLSPTTKGLSRKAAAHSKLPPEHPAAAVDSTLDSRGESYRRAKGSRRSSELHMTTSGRKSARAAATAIMASGQGVPPAPLYSIIPAAPSAHKKMTWQGGREPWRLLRVSMKECMDLSPASVSALHSRQQNCRLCHGEGQTKAAEQGRGVLLERPANKDQPATQHLATMTPAHSKHPGTRSKSDLAREWRTHRETVESGTEVAGKLLKPLAKLPPAAQHLSRLGGQEQVLPPSDIAGYTPGLSLGDMFQSRHELSCCCVHVMHMADVSYVSQPHPLCRQAAGLSFATSIILGSGCEGSRSADGNSVIYKGQNHDRSSSRKWRDQRRQHTALIGNWRLGIPVRLIREVPDPNKPNDDRVCYQFDGLYNVVSWFARDEGPNGEVKHYELTRRTHLV